MAAYQPRHAYGPWLRYQDCDYTRNSWRGSVLVVAKGQQPPQFWCSHAGNQIRCQPQCLDTFQEFNFWRWQLDFCLMQSSSTVEYGVSTEWLQGQAQQKSFKFTLPGVHEPWHWGFHSCNGFSSDVDDSWLPAATTLWQDVMRQHQQSPFHCFVGGGDQLYQDAFFKEPSVVEWLKKDRKTRENSQPTPAMNLEIPHFMFHHYCNWFSKEHMSEAFACIPQVMTWDDHDLMDGWGSYPDSLQNCPVFQNAYHIGRRFYLLFQQHTTLQLAHEQAGLFGNGETFSIIRQLGQNVALVAPDVRGERTRKQVVSPGNWELIFQKIGSLPATVRHLVVLTTIPVVYPKIPLSESAMGLLSTVGNNHAVDTILSKTGLWKKVQGKVVSHFEEPELLDDLLDHWTSDFHIKERDMVITRLQGLSQLRNMRVSFISGDVHVGGLGRLYSHPKVDLRKDYKFMSQVVSSAIINAPPPAGVVTVLHTCSNAHISSADKGTKEKMVRLFKTDYPKTDKLVAKRNWTDLREIPIGSAVPKLPFSLNINGSITLQGGDLLATLRVEKDHKLLANSPIQEYPIIIPFLDTGKPSISPQGNNAGTYGQPSYQSTTGSQPYQNQTTPQFQGSAFPGPSYNSSFPTNYSAPPPQNVTTYESAYQGQPPSHGQNAPQNVAQGYGQPYTQPSSAYSVQNYASSPPPSDFHPPSGYGNTYQQPGAYPPVYQPSQQASYHSQPSSYHSQPSGYHTQPSTASSGGLEAQFSGISLQPSYQNQQAPHGYQTQQGQPAYQSQQGQSAYHIQQGQPGYQNQQGQPGYQNQQGQPGYQNQQGQPGYQNQQGQPGYQNQQGQPGYQNQQGQPGYQNQQGQSGYQSQSGYPSQQGYQQNY